MKGNTVITGRIRILNLPVKPVGTGDAISRATRGHFRNAMKHHGQYVEVTIGGEDKSIVAGAASQHRGRRLANTTDGQTTRENLVITAS